MHQGIKDANLGKLVNDQKYFVTSTASSVLFNGDKYYPSWGIIVIFESETPFVNDVVRLLNTYQVRNCVMLLCMFSESLIFQASGFGTSYDFNI